MKKQIKKILFLALAMVFALTLFVACEAVYNDEENQNESSENSENTNKPENVGTENGSDNESGTTGADSTQGGENTGNGTEGGNTEDDADADKPDVERPELVLLTYEEYNALDGKSQQAYFKKFTSVEAFFAWYNEAKETYKAEHPNIDAGDGEIDLGEIAGGK